MPANRNPGAVRAESTGFPATTSAGPVRPRRVVNRAGAEAASVVEAIPGRKLEADLAP